MAYAGNLLARPNFLLHDSCTQSCVYFVYEVGSRACIFAPLFTSVVMDEDIEVAFQPSRILPLGSSLTVDTVLMVRSFG